MQYEQIVRGQIAVERVERIAAACAKAQAARRARRRLRGYVPRAAGLERGPAAAAYPELQ